MLKQFIYVCGVAAFICLSIVQSAYGVVSYEEFRAAVNRAVKLAAGPTHTPLSQSKNIRESLEYLTNAMELITAKNDYKHAREDLNKAITLNNKNFLAHLVMGITWEMERKPDVANLYYANFMKASAAPMIVFETGMAFNADDILTIRIYVRDLLESRRGNSAFSWPETFSFFNNCPDEKLSLVRMGMSQKEVRKLIGGQQYVPEPIRTSTMDFVPDKFYAGKTAESDTISIGSWDLWLCPVSDFFISETRALQVGYGITNRLALQIRFCNIESKVRLIRR